MLLHMQAHTQENNLRLEKSNFKIKGSKTELLGKGKHLGKHEAKTFLMTK